MANIFSVTNSEELMKALASATGGDTIELAGGDYGDLNLGGGWTDFDVKFEAPVIIRSANAEHPASFSSMELRDVSNLTLEGLVFDYEFNATDPIWIDPFQIWGNSNNITIRNSVFDGDLASGLSDVDNGYGYGVGLNVRDSSNITVENNEFFNWHRGALYSQSDNLIVVGNDIHSIRSDGLNFVEVTSVIIEENYLHDFIASVDSTDHRDMVQFWTTNTDSPTTDVIIRNNIFDIGEGSFTQSIFMRNGEVDTGNAGSEMYYQNILIENNTIYNAHTHGITVGETNGLIVRNNSLLKVEGEMHGLIGSVTIPQINISSDATLVKIEGNVVSSINGFNNQSDWSVSGNAIIQPSEYAEQFITSTLDNSTGLHKFVVLPGSVVEDIGAGSDHIQFPYVADALQPLFQVYSDGDSARSLILDASLTTGPLDHFATDEAEFIWTFGDGSTASGQVVKHEFAQAGYYDVILKVVTATGTSSEAKFIAGVSGEGIVAFDSTSGQFEGTAFGREVVLDTGTSPIVNTSTGYVLKLGGDGIQATVSKNILSGFFGTDKFEMSMALKADSQSSWGEVARIHTSFGAFVDEGGNFKLELFLNDGSRSTIVTENVLLTDGQKHIIDIRFDGGAGFVEISVDGALAARAEINGALGGDVRDLIFGNPWGSKHFEGELSAFSLNAPSLDFPIYTGPAEPFDSSISTGESFTTPELEPTQEDTVTTAPSDSDEVLTPEISEGTNEIPTPTQIESDETGVETPSGSEVMPEEDSGILNPMLQGGYTLDFAAIAISDKIILHDNAHVVDSQDGPAVSFDGKRDFVELGRLTEFEASQRIAFSVDFTSFGADNRSERLVWNHEKIGLSLEGDGVRVHVGNKSNKFEEGFLVTGLGINDGNQHSATIMVDAETDRLQIIVDDVLVLNKEDTDFNFVGVGGHEWGWSLGTSWNRWFEGEVYDFQVSDEFSFVDSARVQEDSSFLV